MYVQQCFGGFPVPLGAGKFEVFGVKATVSDPTAASRLTLIDDMDLPAGNNTGRVLTEDNQKVQFVDIKGVANVDATLEVFFSEPIKTRKGVSTINASNLIGGKVMLYIR